MPDEGPWGCEVVGGRLQVGRVARIIAVEYIILWFGMKQEQSAVSEPLQLVIRVIHKIVSKLSSLGYSKRQINDKLSNIIHSAYKIKSPHFKNFQKWLSDRIRKDQLSKQEAYQLALDLDTYLNSIYDNYDSESEKPEVKLEQPDPPPSAQPPLKKEKKSDPQVKCEEKRLPSWSELRGRLGEMGLESYGNRRLIERLFKRKEVKLEYLNGQNS